jgi:hypothetical protein
LRGSYLDKGTGIVRCGISLVIDEVSYLDKFGARRLPYPRGEFRGGKGSKRGERGEEEEEEEEERRRIVQGSIHYSFDEPLLVIIIHHVDAILEVFPSHTKVRMIRPQGPVPIFDREN